MGAAHVRCFAAEGANVVIGDVVDDLGAELAAELGGAGKYVHLDVSEPNDWSKAVADAERTFGPISVLVNNAGIGPDPARIADTPTEVWRKVLSVNLDGCFFGIRAVVPSMRRAGSGSILNVSSAAGLIGTPMQAPYTTSKFALRGLTKTAAVELGIENIRVNAIFPGYVVTPLLESKGFTSEDAGLDAKLAIPRMAQPEEVSRAVLFLCSSEATYVTGAEFSIDGGYAAGSPVPIYTNVPLSAAYNG
jgi:3alpha(or 20beta)-hydroxysteroid dehydrogenase